MPSERAPEPWRSFLADIDAASSGPIAVHCIGGFAVTLHCALDRPTGDLDVFHVIPDDATPWLATVAGRGSAIHKNHRIYVQIATVATLPCHYADRLTEIFQGEFDKLRLFVVDPYDLALSKLERNLEIDFEDVKHLARSRDLDLALLEARYKDELRPYVSGPVERHDQTLRLWIDAIREERGEGTLPD